MKKFKLITLIVISLLNYKSFAEQPVVGRKAAQKYFKEDAEKINDMAVDKENVLYLHIGRYSSSQAYDWGSAKQVDNAGAANYGVTYLFNEWNGMDANIRVDFSEYSIESNRAVKLSFLPMITFPRAETKFPLYFGIGAGAGIFMQQLTNKSNLSLDYELVVGARFMNLTPSVGAFVEYGLKNHLHILSSGQFNGSCFSGGAVFNF